MTVTSPPDDVVVLPPETTFYLSKDAETYGPHSVAEIRSFLETGAVAPDNLIWTEGMEQWASIGEIIPWPHAIAAPEAAVSDAPIWARRVGDGMARRLGVGVVTAFILHLVLLVSLSVGAAALFKLNTEAATPAPPEPTPLEITMVEEPEDAPPPPPPPPDDIPPPPAIPDVPIPTEMPPPTPQLVTVPQPVITPPTTTVTPVAPLAPPAPKPVKVARRAPPVEAPPASAPVDAGPSDYLDAPPPSYPYAARQGHEEGTVVLLVVINEQGQPVSVTIDRSSGFPILDSVAQKQVANEFRFRVGSSRALRVPISFQEK